MSEDKFWNLCKGLADNEMAATEEEALELMGNTPEAIARTQADNDAWFRRVVEQMKSRFFRVGTDERFITEGLSDDLEGGGDDSR